MKRGHDVVEVGSGMPWTGLVTVLGDALGSLPTESYLVLAVRGSDDRFVQFDKTVGGTLAEVSVPAPARKRGVLRRVFTPPTQDEQLRERAMEHRYSASWERLREAGWSSPLPKQENWWRELPAAAEQEDYHALARETARAFVEELGVAEPTELEYVAWQEAPLRELSLTGLGLPKLASRDWAARMGGMRR